VDFSRASAFKGDSQVAGFMQVFRVKGVAPFGRQKQNFSKDVVASDSDDAMHRVLSILGSKHRINRRQISIDSCEAIEPNTSKDPLVINHFREEIAVAGPAVVEEE
jgi:ribosomal protein L20A (L18A)